MSGKVLIHRTVFKLLMLMWAIEIFNAVDHDSSKSSWEMHVMKWWISTIFLLLSKHLLISHSMNFKKYCYIILKLLFSFYPTWHFLFLFSSYCFLMSLLITLYRVPQVEFIIPAVSTSINIWCLIHFQSWEILPSSVHL